MHSETKMARIKNNKLVFFFRPHCVCIFTISSLRGRMTAKEGPSFTIVSANISWRFLRLDLKSWFEVHLAMY
jgi:hypothetical protein